jgi:dienelactone hydrolase
MKTLSIVLILLFISPKVFALKVLEQQLPFINYIDIPVETENQNFVLSGQYRVPRIESDAAFPAVLVLHSSAGVDSTGSFYIKALNKAGIATLEVDMWGARDLEGGSAGRPYTVQETLPDVFAALKFLVEREEIDAQKIGVLGFSWGGALALLSATEQYNANNAVNYQFAGHVSHYPVCWVYNLLPGFEVSNLTGAPVLIQAGELDGYDQADTCENMVANLSEYDAQYVDLKVYKNAYHAWDRLEPTWIVEDPFANLGQGGEVALYPNENKALKSRKRVVLFFKELFEIE